MIKEFCRSLAVIDGYCCQNLNEGYFGYTQRMMTTTKQKHTGRSQNSVFSPMRMGVYTRVCIVTTALLVSQAFTRILTNDFYFLMDRITFLRKLRMTCPVTLASFIFFHRHLSSLRSVLNYRQ